MIVSLIKDDIEFLERNNLFNQVFNIYSYHLKIVNSNTIMSLCLLANGAKPRKQPFDSLNYRNVVTEMEPHFVLKWESMMHGEIYKIKSRVYQS